LILPPPLLLLLLLLLLQALSCLMALMAVSCR
jgi:hypothetical protein